MITLAFFQLKRLERLLLYHLNENTNLQARFSLSQYGFRTGVFTKTTLHEFVRRIESSLAKKKTLELFLDIVDAFNNITHKIIGDALQKLEVSLFFVSWTEC